MKKVFIYSSIGLILMGCSSKERLQGERKDILLSEYQSSEKDNSPAILDPTTVTLGNTFELKWIGSMDVGSSKSIKMTSPVVVAGNKVFSVDAGGLVYAFDAQTGNLIWKRTTTIKGKDGQIGGAIAYSNGKLIVTSSFAEAFAFNANNGELIWRIKLPACCKGEGITIDNNKVYLLCDNSSLQVVDIKDGNLLWSHSGMMMDTTYMGGSRAIVKNAVVYLAYPSGEVFALSENGASIWSSTLSKFSFVNAGESFSHPVACPIISGNLVYFTNSNQQITAFDTMTGNVVWKRDFGGTETPLVSGNSIFILDSLKGITCLNKDNGKIRWTRNLNINGTEDYGWFWQNKQITEWMGPIQTNKGILIMASNGSLITLSEKDGSVVSRQRIDDFGENSPARPVVIKDMIYFITNDGGVLAFKSK